MSDLQRPAARCVCRELLAAAVLRPLMMYFTPYYANKALYAALRERRPQVRRAGQAVASAQQPTSRASRRRRELVGTPALAHSLLPLAAHAAHDCCAATCCRRRRRGRPRRMRSALSWPRRAARPCAATSCLSSACSTARRRRTLRCRRRASCGTSCAGGGGLRAVGPGQQAGCAGTGGGVRQRVWSRGSPAQNLCWPITPSRQVRHAVFNAHPPAASCPSTHAASRWTTWAWLRSRPWSSLLPPGRHSRPLCTTAHALSRLLTSGRRRSAPQGQQQLHRTGRQRVVAAASEGCQVGSCGLRAHR